MLNRSMELASNGVLVALKICPNCVIAASMPFSTVPAIASRPPSAPRPTSAPQPALTGSAKRQMV